MNVFLNNLKEETNFTYTENGAITHKTTMNGLLDLFALGAAYRNRSAEDCIVLFMKAFEEDEVYAMKCLFYLRDIMQGQGERRFFRIVCHYLAKHHLPVIQRNLKYVSEFGRWDDIIYICYGTKLWDDCIELIKQQMVLDAQSVLVSEKQGISLLGKWLPSENTSSVTTRKMAHAVRESLGMTHKQYRKTLSTLRERINVLERLMSAGKWDEIEFDKVPSNAGFKYRNAFARHDIERMKSEKQVVSYKDFMADENTTVNAKALYPYEVVAKAFMITNRNYYWNTIFNDSDANATERNAINKYWDNLKDVFNGYSFNGLCICDTSGSMWGSSASAPINVAISIALYCAEKAAGPFKGHYISFSSRPQLIETVGVDFCDKVQRIYQTNLCENTNIEATFDLVLNTALKNHLKQEDLPENLIIVSDMEFDAASSEGWWDRNVDKKTLMENIAIKWSAAGYKMPNLIFWNVDARQDNIPMKVEEGITMVSGFSTVLFEQIMKGLSAWDLVKDKLDSERYACIK